MLHASEVAFWADLPTQLAALMQTTPDLDNTEIILETTANSFNDFYKLWRKSEAGESEFIPVFLPWSLAEEYRRADDDFVMDAEESKLADLHGLDAEQMAWRRAKVSQLGSAELFPQEYPLTASEAFIAPSFDSFIPAELTCCARARRRSSRTAPLIIGVDPAGMGADATAIAWRRGHVITKIEKRRGIDTMQTTGWVPKIIREDGSPKINIDVGGAGHRN